VQQNKRLLTVINDLDELFCELIIYRRITCQRSTEMQIRRHKAQVQQRSSKRILLLRVLPQKVIKAVLPMVEFLEVEAMLCCAVRDRAVQSETVLCSQRPCCAVRDRAPAFWGELAELAVIDA